MTKLPIPAKVLAQHVAILGKTRSGKSSVMRLLVEDLLERKLPVCIIDPKGDWYGIKLAGDGKAPGYPVVIFGGEHADIPIDETKGAEVAELFATGNRPCLVDMGGWMVAPRTRFWIDFASTLFKLTKGERWLAVDEFHNFAPKGTLKGREGEAAKALHWSNRLASEGLGKGLALLFASQRPQKVHNDALTSAETLIAMRVLHPSDRGAVSDWIKGCGDSEGSEVLSSLAQMERGEGWVWSPEIGFGPKRVKFPLFHTYDSFRAQTAADAKRLTGWAEVDLAQVRQKFAATIERAKADDPSELRKQIAELKRVNAQHAKAAAASAPAKEKRVEVPVLKDGQVKRLENIAAAIAGAGEKLATASAQLVTVSREILEGLRRIPTNGHRPPVPTSRLLSSSTARPSTTSAVSASRNVQARVAASSGTAHGEDDRLSSAQQSILNAAAFLESVGIEAPSAVQLAVFAGQSATGGYWRANIGRCRTLGLIEGTRLTAEGRARAQPAEITTPEELHAHIGTNLLNGPQRKILDVLIAAYPEALSAEEVGIRAELKPNGGYWRANVGRLRSLGLITKKGPMAALPLLFLEAAT